MNADAVSPSLARQSLPGPRVHPTYVRLLCILLRGEGVDVDALLTHAGLDGAQLAVETQMLSFAQLRPLIHAASAASLDVRRPLGAGPSQNPGLGFGLTLGQRTPLSAHGALGYVVVVSRDLRQALEAVVRFASLRNELLRFELEEASSGLLLQGLERSELAEARPFVLGMVLGTLLRLMEAVLGARPQGLQVELPLKRPDATAEALFQGCVEGALLWSAPALRVHLPAAVLAQPCLTADARAHQVAWQDCERELSQQAGGLGPWSQRVQQCLLQRRAPVPFPSLVDVAGRCHVSARTLIRRLRMEGNSYQQLLDGLRQEQALEALRHGRLSTEQIAFELGFEDASNFSRTVRKWFGLTPSALRERLRS